jgi:hypothetical protein
MRKMWVWLARTSRKYYEGCSNYNILILKFRVIKHNENHKKMEQNRIRQIGRVFLFLIFLSISTKHFMNYLDYSSSFTSNNILPYTIEDKSVKRGGRGQSYIMKINHSDSIITEVSITSQECRLIDNREFPILYTTKSSGKIFSESIVKKARIISIFFFIVSIVILFIPWK